MSEALIGLLGALVGGIAALGGALLQARTAERQARDEADRRAKEARDEADRRANDADRRASEAFHALAQRYLFQLQEAVDSLRSRIANWAHYGGREYSELKDPGYWEPTTIYAFGRALGAERILALEGVYVELDRLGRGLTPFRVTRAVQSAMGGVFFYHLLALAESVLDRGPDGFRLVTYTEFRRRYDDAQSGLQLYMKPATEALSRQTPEQLKKLEQPLAEVSEQLTSVTGSRSYLVPTGRQQQAEQLPTGESWSS